MTYRVRTYAGVLSGVWPNIDRAIQFAEDNHLSYEIIDENGSIVAWRYGLCKAQLQDMQNTLWAKW